MKVTLTQGGNRLTANAADLAAHYKRLGYSKHYAWDMFVKDRGLRPEINASEFYRIFENVSAAALDSTRTVEFHATHHDTLLDMPCQVTDDEQGVHHIVWPHGMSGSHPPNDTTFTTRFVPFILRGD